ncbi:hypothetical protein DV736_g3145, partial [Chaetothyriales sp. CBS 134916]
MPTQPNLYSYPDVDTVAASLRKYVLSSQEAALARHGKFKIAVSGGSLPAMLSKALLAPDNGTEGDKIRFSKWEVFFADERAVPLDDEDSNYGLLKKALLDHIPASSGVPRVYPIDVQYLNDTQELADQYQEALMSSFASKDSVRLPLFDLILLGCGPDGHTCSLFPGHRLLREKDSWVAAIEDSPKMPPRRITLTLAVVIASFKIAFVATGAGKKEILKKILETEEGRSLPCGLVNEGAGEKVSWFTDVAATEAAAMPPTLDNVLIKLDDDGVAVINYNRPKNANALSAGTMRDLLTAFTWAHDHYKLDLVDVPTEGPILSDTNIEILSKTHTLLINSTKPFIAAINGPAIGWGSTSLALFDLVYSVPDAIFFTPFVKLGLAAEACSSVTFQRVMGRQKAAALILAGEQFTATDLERAGLITKILPKEGFMEEVLAIARRMANQPPLALAENKRLMMEPIKAELLAANERECEALRRRGRSGEPREAIRRFEEEQAAKKKKKPKL